MGQQQSLSLSPPPKAAVAIGMGQQPLSLSPAPKAALTFMEVWERENEKRESPFDSALFSPSLHPADGAFDAAPQPSPLPPKPKIQQMVGDAAGAFGQQAPWQTVQTRNSAHSKTLDTVVAKAIISITSSLGGGPVEQGVCSMVAK